MRKGLYLTDTKTNPSKAFRNFEISIVTDMCIQDSKKYFESYSCGGLSIKLRKLCSKDNGLVGKKNSEKRDGWCRFGVLDLTQIWHWVVLNTPLLEDYDDWQMCGAVLLLIYYGVAVLVDLNALLLGEILKNLLSE